VGYQASGDSGKMVKSLFVILAGVALLGLVLYVIDHVRRGRRPAEAPAADPVAAAIPDLRDESVLADHLAPDEWTLLALDLIRNGDFRSAVRALYFSALGSLSQQELVRIARFKTNREYAKEVRRRARHDTSLPVAFERCMEIFERTWYGTHPADPETIAEFRQQLDWIRKQGAVSS
jgi:hypothetical protein